MTRALVTGVAGFTGRYVAALLAEKGHEVHGLVHQHDDESIEGVHQLYEADIADLTSIKQAVDEIRPDVVVHLAGIAFVAHADVEQIYRSNVVGTRQLLEALAGLAEAPQAVLLASSANVYGNASGGEIEEAAGLAPSNDYAVSKVAMEYVASLYGDRLPLIVARPFNYTGRGQSPQFIIPKIVSHALQGASSIELGNLDVARDFSDVRTVARIYGQLLDEPKAIGGTFNVCSGIAVTLQRVLELVWGISGRRFEVRVNPAFVRSNEVRILQGSKSKLESVIGPIASIPLEDTLRWMMAE